MSNRDSVNADTLSSSNNSSTSTITNNTPSTSDGTSTNKDCTTTTTTSSDVPSNIELSENQIICKIHKKEEGQIKSLIMKENWIDSICTCPACTELYKSCSVLYLLEEKVKSEKAISEINHEHDDTDSNIQLHDGDIKEDSDTMIPLMAAGGNLMNGNSVTDAVTIAHGVNLFQEKLKTFLGTFASGKRTVTERDVQQFMEDLNKAKRRRLNNHLKDH
eukprot:TRINITY_DN1556_c0_g1_i3.p1 TRINITY_DN1556_c0_g1~~TRINITY_DN1556_c0_g1_i3.p1  ORF type:complete len:218 (-),score=40.18 TRINITY_DN1556_c0_g1_i3:384-1037(-)